MRQNTWIKNETFFILSIRLACGFLPQVVLAASSTRVPLDASKKIDTDQLRGINIEALSHKTIFAELNNGSKIPIIDAQSLEDMFPSSERVPNTEFKNAELSPDKNFVAISLSHHLKAHGGILDLKHNQVTALPIDGKFIWSPNSECLLAVSPMGETGLDSVMFYDATLNQLKTVYQQNFDTDELPLDISTMTWSFDGNLVHLVLRQPKNKSSIPLNVQRYEIFAPSLRTPEKNKISPNGIRLDPNPAPPPFMQHHEDDITIHNDTGTLDDATLGQVVLTHLKQNPQWLGLKNSPELRVVRVKRVTGAAGIKDQIFINLVQTEKGIDVERTTVAISIDPTRFPDIHFNLASALANANIILPGPPNVQYSKTLLEQRTHSSSANFIRQKIRWINNQWRIVDIFSVDDYTGIVDGKGNVYVWDERVY